MPAHRMGGCLGEGVWWDKYKNGAQNRGQALKELCADCVEILTDPRNCWDGTCQTCCREAIIEHIAEFGLNGKNLYYLLKTLEGVEPVWKPGDPDPGHDDDLNRDFYERVRNAFPKNVEEKYG